MLRILVVDDHALFRAGLVGLLKTQPDFEIAGEAGNAGEAVTLANSLKPDVILMDLGLPDGSGIEAMTHILKRNPHTKTVILTIHESETQAFEAIRRGAKGFLFKDISTVKLMESLRALQRGEMAVSRLVLSRFVEETLHWISPQAQEWRRERGITTREIEIMAELTTGSSNREIAGQLNISENTVKVHVHNILEKLGLRSRRELAEFARRHGLSSDPSPTPFQYSTGDHNPGNLPPSSGVIS
jgi:DNA-binding NarL/FixJ family response regulator